MDRLVDQKIPIFETLLLEIQQKIVNVLSAQDTDELHLLNEKVKLIENYLIQIGHKIENGSIFDDNELGLGGPTSTFEQEDFSRPVNIADNKLGQENGTTSNDIDIGPFALSPSPNADLDFSKIKLEPLDKELIVVLERLPESLVQEYQNARKTKKRKLNARNSRFRRNTDPYNNVGGRPIKVEHIYCCTKCTRKKYFKTSLLLKYHIQRCHTILKDPILKCTIDQCTQKFHSFKSRFDHIKENHTSCTRCSAKFSKRAQLVHHIKDKHGNEGLFNCSKCPKKFFFRYPFAQHLRKDHLMDDTSIQIILPLKRKRKDKIQEGLRVRGGLLCKFEGCQEGYLTHDELHVHRNKIHGFDIFKCSICSRNVSNKKNLAAHYRKMHGGVKRPNRLYCDFENCTKNFPSIKKTTYYLHRMRHTIQDLDSFVEKKTCPICKTVIENIQQLKLHIVGHDKNNIKNTCRVCAKIFSTPCILRRHENTVHESSVKFCCEICGLSFKNDLTFESHKKRKHGNFVCSFPLCKYICASQNVLDNHYEGSHKEINLCPYCSKEFINTSKLTCHINMVHTREYNCTFPQCSEVFTSEVNLNKHKVEVHSEMEYQYQCCSRNYWSKGFLRIHVRRTHGIPFKCSVDGCDRVFKRKYELTSHEQSHYK